MRTLEDEVGAGAGTTKSNRVRITLRTVLQNVAVYGLAAAIIWYEARGIPLRNLMADLAHANLLWFLPATLISFCIWFFGENLLFARMFTHFHWRTGYLELLPATAAAYFLRLVNALVADGALILFLHRRKHVPWLAGTFSFLFLGFIDGYVFGLLTLLSGLFIPGSPLRTYLPYAAGFLGALSLIAAWWMFRTPTTRLEGWIYYRPSLVSFRTARARTYFELGAIRLAIFLPEALLLYIAMLAFHVHVPLLIFFAVFPLILAASGVPLTPTGLGPLQAVALYEFAQYASTSSILVSFLAMSVALLLYRLPLGLGSAGAYARVILKSGHQPPSIHSSQRS
jgi:uncharacterized membrane protein YbhN (UPF0104 family)